MSLHREVYDLIVAGLEKGSSGLVISDRGLEQLAQKLASSSGDQQAEALLGVLSAMDFLGTQPDGRPAQASLLAVFITVFERVQLDQETHDAFDKRLQEITGRAPEQKLPAAGPRPEGTVTAGPGARFALADKGKGPKSK